MDDIKRKHLNEQGKKKERKDDKKRERRLPWESQIKKKRKWEGQGNIESVR